MIYSPTELHRTLRAQVTVGGITYDVTRFPELDRDIDTMISSCEVSLSEPVPEATYYTTAYVDYSINDGVTWYRLFTGTLLPDQFSYAPLDYRYTISDILYKLDTTASTEISLTGMGYMTALETLLNEAGISSASISLPTSLSSDMIERATLGEYVVEKGADLQSTIQTLLDFGRYRLYTDSAGVVKAVKYSRIPIANPSTIFSTQPTSLEYGIIHIVCEINPNQDIVNRVTVSGNGEDIEGEWGTTEVEGKGTTGIRNDFCTTVEQCDELAQDIGIDECRSERTYDIKMPTDHTLIPGTSIYLKAPEININTAIPAKIIKQSITGATMDIVCSVGGRAIDDEGVYDPEEEIYDPIQGPTATFSYTLEREASDYGILLDASGSSSDAGDIVSYNWVFYGMKPGYPSPTPTDTKQLFCLIKDTDGVSIELTVTDSDGRTDTFTQVISDTIIVPMTRMLSAIIDDRWYVLVNYAIGWQDITPVNTYAYIIPRYQDSRYFFMVSTSGSLYRFDTLNAGIIPSKIGQFGGVGGHVNYYCMDQGRASYSKESGNRLVISGTPSNIRSENAIYPEENITYYTYANPDGAASYASRIDYKHPDTIYTIQDTNLSVSYDNLVTTENPIYTSDKQLTDFQLTRWVTPKYLGLRRSQEEPNDAIWPIDIDWTGVDPEPSEITAMAPSEHYGGIYIGTKTGQIYSYDMGTGVITHLITVPVDSVENNQILQIVPDIAFPGLVWLRVYSTDYTIAKLLNNSSLNVVFSTTVHTEEGTGLGSARIPWSTFGYGPVGEYEVNFTKNNIFILTAGATGDADKLWRLETHKGKWHAIEYPESGYYWSYLKVLDNEMFLVGNANISGGYYARIYYSNDRGLNWYLLTPTQPDYSISIPSGLYGNAIGSAFKYGGTWYCVSKVKFNFGFANYTYSALFRMNGTNLEWVLNLTGYGIDYAFVQSSELVNGSKVIYRASDGNISFRGNYYFGSYDIATNTNLRTKEDYQHPARPINYSGNHGYAKISQYPNGDLIFGALDGGQVNAMNATVGGYQLDSTDEDVFGTYWGHDFTYNSKGELFAVRRTYGTTYRAGVNKVPYPVVGEDVIEGPTTCNEYDAGTLYDFNGNIVCSTDDTVAVIDRNLVRVIIRDPNTEVWNAINFPTEIMGGSLVSPFIAIEEIL